MIVLDKICTWLKRNLLFIGVLDKKGYSIPAKDGDMKISLGSMTVMKGKRHNGIYILKGKTVTDTADVITQDKTKLSHLRFAHVSEKGLHARTQ